MCTTQLHFLCDVPFHVQSYYQGKGQCPFSTGGDRMVDILPISTSKNPRRSLTSQSTMARTKDRIHYYRAKRANELAAVAQCMDGYLREKNTTLENAIQLLKMEYQRSIKRERERSLHYREMQRRRHMREIQHSEQIAMTMIVRRQQRIRDLEAQWEDMANTLHDAIEENEKLKEKVKNIEEQLLDCNCFEKETLSDNDSE